jgi:hypothetical protein
MRHVPAAAAALAFAVLSPPGAARAGGPPGDVRAGQIPSAQIGGAQIGGAQIGGAQIGGAQIGGANEEIVVTGSYARGYDDLAIPHVAVAKRADFAILRLTLRDDTRDLSERLGEMTGALANLDKAARAGAVTLALEDEDAGLVRAFSVAAAAEALQADKRPDSSRLDILLRTPVARADTLEAIHKRFSGFVAHVAKPGRVEMEPGALELTLVNPEGHRAMLLAAVTVDGRATAAALGAGYGLRLSGLERRVAWKRTGDLELTMFIPYKLEIAPAGAQP